MILPGLITIITPVIIGLVFGAEPLGGYMAGVCVSGVMWAIFQNNAGGAWDNAKKSFEAGVEINGEMTYKGSDAHKAAVTGDTVGDPFKDTSGPSMNILIKLTCLVGLVIAPILAGHSSSDTHEKTEDIKVWIDKNGQKHEIKLSNDAEFTTENRLENIVKVNIEKNDDGTAKATITTTIIKNGEETTEEKTFEGTLEEVEKKIKEYENSKKE